MTTFAEIGVDRISLSEKLTIVGVTDGVTECLCCGKQNLKRTVVVKDNDSNYSFFGTTCADRHTKGRWSQSNKKNTKVHAPIEGWIKCDIRGNELIRFIKINDVNCIIERWHPYKNEWREYFGPNQLLQYMKVFSLDSNAQRIKAEIEKLIENMK